MLSTKYLTFIFSLSSFNYYCIMFSHLHPHNIAYIFLEKKNQDFIFLIVTETS